MSRFVACVMICVPATLVLFSAAPAEETRTNRAAETFLSKSSSTGTEATPTKTGRQHEFRFVDGFSSMQGANHWYYKEWNGSRYSDMRWDAVARRWKGRRKYCQVWKGAAHPDATEAVIAWQAPSSGSITIQGVIERPNTLGDATRIRILKNQAQLWPSEPWQPVYPSFMVQHSLVTDVELGDWIFFHVNRFESYDYDDTLWSPTIRYDAPPKFLLGGARYVMVPSALKRMNMHTMDASLSVLPLARGNRFFWFHSEEHGSHHQKFVGTLDRPARRLVFEKTARQFFRANPSRADGKWWLTNLYRDRDGSLLGFVHVESAGNGKKFRLGLAHSTNSGNTWTYLGHIIKQHGDPDGVNITGSPYVIKGEYFYVYYRDRAGASVARARVADVMAAAKRGRRTPWHKFYGGEWNEPGWGGRSTALGVQNGFLHSDAAFCRTKKRYLLTGYNHGRGRGVWIAFSNDAVHWTKGDWLQHGARGNRTLSPYVTIVNADGTDNAEVDDSFYAYWGFNPNWDKTGNIGLQYLVRQKVTLIAP